MLRTKSLASLFVMDQFKSKYEKIAQHYIFLMRKISKKNFSYQIGTFTKSVYYTVTSKFSPVSLANFASVRLSGFITDTITK